jgi:hypothetical protein
MDGRPTEWWRLGLLIALLLLSPIVFHPWWLFIISALVYCLLVKLLFKGERNAALKEGALPTTWRDAEMLIRQLRRHAAAWRTI